LNLEPPVLPLDPGPGPAPSNVNVNLNPFPKNITVIIWPLGFRGDKPVEPAVVEPVVEKIKTSAGEESARAVRELMEYL
jgi:hypothetical protein